MGHVASRRACKIEESSRERSVDLIELLSPSLRHLQALSFWTILVHSEIGLATSGFPLRYASTRITHRPYIYIHSKEFC